MLQNFQNLQQFMNIKFPDAILQLLILEKKVIKKQ